MNKLINLLIIFLALNYILPFAIGNIQSVPRTLFYISLVSSTGIFLLEVIYNYSLKQSNIKPMTLKENIYNSLFKALLVFVGFYIYEDMKTNYSITIPGVSEDNTIRSIFIIFIMTFFIITKCLITP